MAENPINDILRKSLVDRKTNYGSTDIQKVIIDGNEFTGYKTFSSFWELTYSKSPERSTGGVIGNLNSIPCFVTPHLKINFAMMDIDSYRRLYNLILDRREFVVKYYDVVNNVVTTQKMYFAPDQLPTLYAVARKLNGEEWVEVLGVQNYTVELIGTNNELDTVDILYYDENGNLIPEATQNVTLNDEVVVNYNYQPTNPNVRFDGMWRKNENVEGASIVINGSVITASTASKEDEESGVKVLHIKLYAVVVNSTTFTLSLDYGLGEKPVPQSSESNIDSFEIATDNYISSAIEAKNIKLANGSDFTLDLLLKGTGVEQVEYEGEKLDAYVFKGWYSVPTLPTVYVDDYKIKPDTTYKYGINKTIYQIYTPKTSNVTYVTNKDGISLSQATIEYNAKVPLPTFNVGSESITGWYLDAGFTKPFNGIMPPKDITIYAKWE